MDIILAAISAADFTSLGSALVLLVAALGAVGWLMSRGYKTFKRVEKGILELVGSEDHPSLREDITALRGEVQEVKQVALRSEKELHPNGGSSLRDDVRKANSAISEAATIALDAKRAAVELGERLEENSTTAHGERAELRVALTTMRDDITTEMSARTAETFSLLAEHGGPDLRDHTLIPVPPHIHALPTAEITTSLPVDPTT